ncbi:transcriptional regulator [Sulfurimonas gotlandica]|uniref:transcriptional regulator n=1 Tax=Sulfurimonas gotlandica TaxID=1176482 RepID=UPI0011120836|nr:transcriptional regulator [Sulfurimonas gotlandica]
MTCIVKHGSGEKVVAMAREVGVSGEIIFNARGAGIRERLGLWGIAVEVDKDVVTMMTSIENRDLLIHHLYTKLGLNRPGAGVVYATALDKVATYIPEAVLSTLEKEGPQ